MVFATPWRAMPEAHQQGGLLTVARRDLLKLLIDVRKMFRDTDVDNSGSIDERELEVRMSTRTQH